ncbi:hypothetical protein S83_063018, partial [Arachis hypogaea]
RRLPCAHFAGGRRKQNQHLVPRVAVIFVFLFRPLIQLVSFFHRRSQVSFLRPCSFNVEVTPFAYRTRLLLLVCFLPMLMGSFTQS